MLKIKLFLAVIAVAIGAALTYHVFENSVHMAIDLVWYDWFDTDKNRLLVVPLAVVLAIAYFGAQHLLDRESEDKEEHGLGGTPAPTITNYLKILGIGFLSLLAGASLGPEAILVPACIVIGAIAGDLFFNDKKISGLLMAAGIMALFTAFFHSALVGVLSLFLVTKQMNTKPNTMLILTAILASVASYVTLKLVSAEAFAQLPHYGWYIDGTTLTANVALVFAGYGIIFGMDYMSIISRKIKDAFQDRTWWSRALVASLVISVLYLLGGPLVEFTGNRSIVPMFSEASSLGLIGLVWVLVIKMAAISWSKAIGYRGGMIFPTIFLAAVLVAIVQLYVADFNLIYGLVAVLIGAFVANRKTRVLV